MADSTTDQTQDGHAFQGGAGASGGPGDAPWGVAPPRTDDEREAARPAAAGEPPLPDAASVEDLGAIPARDDGGAEAPPPESGAPFFADAGEGFDAGSPFAEPAAGFQDERGAGPFAPPAADGAIEVSEPAGIGESLPGARSAVDADADSEFHKDGLRQPRADGASQAWVSGQDEPREGRRQADTIMLVNDVPGDEMRIALVRNGRLDAYFAERAASATNVGNIYKGRVTNVEPAIQAAFVDFGESQNGFLHISDLHPRYFPGAERSESVGRKIPRRDRPPMQEALRRGQEVLVQVIKEGIGTKGPTLTSYLSIPGRLLVMMPEMDNVGVSRKVDDEDQRREMRKILDSLDLPDGFGFILRTAGFDRSRTELQRDATYLTRLWQAMEKRMERSGAPCELYTESDLLVRTIRDVVDDSVHTIVVDTEAAWDRANLFLEVAFPKDPPRVLYYDRAAPIFHAFGVERQIMQIHAREVPLPSGGALVFDQAEAMVAIDVNSGKSRSARDSETNAFNTNREAVEEICRQLRLRELGGLVVCDLIDMRSHKHRREIEERFRENLRRDRAKTTVLPISEFGMVELTRQRMRPSLHKMHFMDCPHCTGTGSVKIPESTAAEALREVQALLEHERIHRVEMVCSVKVASVLLSSKRERLYEIERRTGRRVDVRISEALSVDRVDLYAYDDRGADVEISRVSQPKPPRLEDLPVEPPEDLEEPVARGPAVAAEEERTEGGGRRRRRRRRPAPADATAMALAGGFDDLPEVRDDEPSALSEVRAREAAEKAARKAAEAEAAAAKAAARQAAKAGADGAADGASQDEAGEGGRRRRRRRRGRRGRGPDGAEAVETAAGAVGAKAVRAEAPAPPPPPPPPPEPRRVHLLAKEFGVTSKDLLAALRERATAEMPLDAKNHMSTLPSEWVAVAISIYAPPPPPPPAPVATGGASDGDDGQEGENGEGGDGAQVPGQPGEGGGRRKRRRRRRGRGGSGGNGGGGNGGSDAGQGGHAQGGQPAGGEGGEGGGRRKRRRRRRGRGGSGGGEGSGGGGGGGSNGNSAGRQGGAWPESPRPAAPAPTPTPTVSQSPKPATPRGLYGRVTRKLGPNVKYNDR